MEPDMEACEAKCTALGEEKFAAFSFCDGSNCKGSCALYPPPLEQYTRCNGYPGSTCYVRPQKATSEATPTEDGSGPGPKDKLVESFEIDLDLALILKGEGEIRIARAEVL